MEIIKTSASIVKFALGDHKKEFLEKISLMGEHSMFCQGQHTFNTDWEVANDVERPYYQDFLSLIQPCLVEFSEKMKIRHGVLPNNHWFQQYQEGDYHDWHNHPGSSYTSVYYVELPDKTATQFEHLGNEFEIDVEEGDYIIFPSYLRHCSKPNMSGRMKTIISLNLD